MCVCVCVSVPIDFYMYKYIFICVCACECVYVCGKREREREIRRWREKESERAMNKCDKSNRNISWYLFIFRLFSTNLDLLVIVWFLERIFSNEVFYFSCRVLKIFDLL